MNQERMIIMGAGMSFLQTSVLLFLYIQFCIPWVCSGKELSMWYFQIPRQRSKPIVSREREYQRIWLSSGIPLVPVDDNFVSCDMLLLTAADDVNWTCQCTYLFNSKTTWPDYRSQKNEKCAHVKLRCSDEDKFAEETKSCASLSLNSALQQQTHQLRVC